MMLSTLVTGSNGGIGMGIVRHLLENGVRNIACHYRTESAQISDLLKQFDLNPINHLFQAELTDPLSVARMRNEVEARIGSISALLNVAGMSKNGMSWKITPEDFHQVINNNLTSAFLCAREVIPGMRERQGGRIINFASIVGFTGVPGASHYCAAKAGLVGLTKGLALELANKQISVNVIALGYFDCGLIDEVPAEMQLQIKNRIPVGRFGKACEVGAMVKYLLSEEAAFVTGQVFHLNGGQY